MSLSDLPYLNFLPWFSIVFLPSRLLSLAQMWATEKGEKVPADLEDPVKQVGFGGILSGTLLKSTFQGIHSSISTDSSGQSQGRIRMWSWGTGHLSCEHLAHDSTESRTLAHVN